MNYKLDKTVATLLPFAKTKGSVEQRLQRATEMNLRFYKNLKYDFDSTHQITSAKFRRNLLDTVGSKLSIKVSPNFERKNVAIGVAINPKDIVKGYSLLYPKDRLTGKNIVGQSQAPLFLQVTQHFFTRLFNPKMNARIVHILNGKHGYAETMKFYDENIKDAKELKPEKLDNFLAGKSPSGVINILQLYRYKLISDINAKNAEPLINREIAKVEHIQYNPAKFDTRPCSYEEKLEIISKKLKEVLERTRDRISRGLLS